jgi:hypothetical protein
MPPVGLELRITDKRAAAEPRLLPRGHWDRSKATRPVTNAIWAGLESNLILSDSNSAI